MFMEAGKMTYTISEIAKIMNVPSSTIRYYDKKGLLPNINRKNRIRIFEDKDFIDLFISLFNILFS